MMKLPATYFHGLSLALLLCTISSLSLGRVSAFSFSPAVTSTSTKSTAGDGGLVGRSRATRHSNGRDPSLRSSSSSERGDHEYDYDELLASEWEQKRLKSMYVPFGNDEWLAHRASDRFYRNVLQFFESPIVNNLWDEVAVLVAICVMIIVWNGSTVDGYTDFAELHHDAPLVDVIPHWLQVRFSLPTDPFFLCGGPLGLLLVFRNDVSFGRYKHALTHWEMVITSLTNLQLMACNTGSDVAAVNELGMASTVLCRTLQHELSGKFDPVRAYEKDVRRILSDDATPRAERLLGARNKLLRAQYDVHRAVEAIAPELTNVDKRAMINFVNAVVGACSECEKLYKMPIPLLYTRHTLKFLSLWMVFMPFAFYDVFASSWNHVLMIPAIAIICFLFFGIEEIAVSLEEPFSILPMEEFVEEIYSKVNDTTEWMEERTSVSLDEGSEPLGIGGGER